MSTQLPVSVVQHFTTVCISFCITTVFEGVLQLGTFGWDLVCSLTQSVTSAMFPLSIFTAAGTILYFLYVLICLLKTLSHAAS